MLTIQEVFKRAGNDDVSLVIDEPIYYMVLNTKLNIQGLPFLSKVQQILDQVEKTQGSGVLVTINSGNKVFSILSERECEGESIKIWEEGKTNGQTNKKLV